VLTVWRVELRKLASQLSVRLVVILCAAGPFVLAAVLKLQKGVPADTLFGRWVHFSGLAIPFFSLGFVAPLGLPLLCGIVGGDIFASEDRYGTWKTVLTRSRSRAQLFAGKALAAASFSVLIVVLLAVASTLAGLAIVGTQPLVGLSGQLVSPWHATGLAAASWGFALLPALGFTSLALLFSVLTRSGVAGVLAPVVVAFAMQLMAMLSGGEIMRALLLGTAFDAWHGLLTEHPYYGPLLASAAACVVYSTVCIAVAWLVLARRDFAGADAHRRTGWVGAVGWTGAGVAVVALLSVAGRFGPDGIDAIRLEDAISPTFGNLVVFQQKVIGHKVPPGAAVIVLPSCNRPGGSLNGPSRGAGDDWRCTLSIGLGGQQSSLVYDVQVRTDGCYRADGPPTIVGPPTIRDVHGRPVPNPVLHFDGCFDTT
jgi:ABC-2 type transport system permease protein